MRFTDNKQRLRAKKIYFIFCRYIVVFVLETTIVDENRRDGCPVENPWQICIAGEHFLENETARDGVQSLAGHLSPVKTVSEVVRADRALFVRFRTPSCCLLSAARKCQVYYAALVTFVSCVLATAVIARDRRNERPVFWYGS